MAEANNPPKPTDTAILQNLLAIKPSGPMAKALWPKLKAATQGLSDDQIKPALQQVMADFAKDRAGTPKDEQETTV